MSVAKLKCTRRRRYARLLLKTAANEHSKKLAQRLIDSWLEEQDSSIKNFEEKTQ